jgi:hypothetical protein
MMSDIKVLDAENAKGYAIRCEQSEAETEGDIQELMASIRAGHITETLFDEETDEEIPGDKMTDAQLREAAEGYISDFGRDGWSVSWVRQEAGGNIHYVANREDMTLYPTLEMALVVASGLGTSDAVEVWGMV